MPSSQPVDLNNCDHEPIHIPGAIQPHGCLIACDAGVSVIRRISANAAAMLGRDARDLVDARFDAVFGKRLTHDLRNALTGASSPSRPGLMLGVVPGEGLPPMDIAVHAYKGTAIVELEPAANSSAGTPLEIARTLIARLGKLEDPDALIAGSVRLVRAMLGYDRVMVYRFAPDGSGEVVSEAKRGDLESFLGQHFPATDIPLQARRLYLDNTIRVIGDASAVPVPVQPRLIAGEPLDLSYAHLRAVSPIHCEYLRNMGVAASMSASIIVDGELWGLIACHHYAPRHLAMAQRVAAEMFGQFFAMKLESLNRKRSHELAITARRKLDSLLQHMSHHLDVVELLRENLGSFERLIPCDGIGLWINGNWDGHGIAPPTDAIPALVRFINTVSEGRCWATNALSERLPLARQFAESVSGVLAIPLSQIPRDYLLLFRKEVLQTVNWAGDPNKEYAVGPRATA